MKKIILKLAALLWMFGRSNFYRDMADAFDRKVSIRDFLQREVDNARMLKDETTLLIMKSLVRRYASGSGSSLRELLYGIAPASDMMLLSAVDDAVEGKAEALKRAAEAVDFQIRTFKTILISLATPAIAMPLVGALCVITSEIIASIARDAPASVWVGFNGIVRIIAEFINAHWGKVFLAICATAIFIVWQLPRWTGPSRVRVDSLPGFALYRDYNAAVVLSAMSMMIGSGKTMRQALEDLRLSATPWLRWHLQRVINSLDSNPTDYLAAFSRGLMPLSVRARLNSLLDSSKSFDVALVSLGASEVKRLEGAVKVSAEMVNWTLTGALVALAVVLSIGQMTIASALSTESDPIKLMQKR
jgi:hypothetical protein